MPPAFTFPATCPKCERTHPYIASVERMRGFAGIDLQDDGTIIHDGDTDIDWDYSYTGQYIFTCCYSDVGEELTAEIDARIENTRFENESDIPEGFKL